jgi:hypothetical protein
MLVASLLFGLPLFAYLMAIAIYSVFFTDLPTGQKLRLIAVLPTMHLSWGVGFWWGLARGVR